MNASARTDCSSWPAHSPRCPVAHSSTRSSMKSRRGHARTAGTPTTLRCCGSSGPRDDRSPSTAPAHRSGLQNLVLSVMGVLVLAATAAGGILLNRTDHVSGELIDNIQPARVAAYRLQAALRDQETALRGYAIAADRQFLEP